MSDHIPFHIQAEIIKKLPIKSLIQFRSVSKTWKSLIDSSRFIANYKKNTQQRLLVGDSFDEDGYVSLLDNDTFPHQMVSLTLPNAVLNLKRPPIGCSQGLFCFYNCLTNQIFIWNPTIRKSVDLVVPNMLDSKVYITTLGFGVCPRTLDPMLVKISTEHGCRVPVTINSTWLVEVFRLSSGVWKTLSVDLPWFIAADWNQVVIDKFIYWCARDQRTGCGCDLIVSFDMISEEFTEIRLPDSLLQRNVDYDMLNMLLVIRKLKESLVVLQLDHAQTDFCRVLGVWLMKNGDPKSFENIYTIQSNIPNRVIKGVLEFNRNGKPIVLMTKELDEEEENELVIYEPNSQHVDHLGISTKMSWLCVRSYTETLILLDH